MRTPVRAARSGCPLAILFGIAIAGGGCHSPQGDHRVADSQPLQLGALPTTTATSMPSCDSTSVAGKWCEREVTNFKWRAGHPPYQFIIEEPLDSADLENIGPRLRIRFPGGGERVFYDSIGPGGLDSVDVRMLDSTIISASPIRSGYIVATTKILGPNGEPTIFVAGWGYASDASTFRLIGLDTTGIPYEMFRADHFDLRSFEDLDGDGRPEIIGFEGMSEEFGRCYETYNPLYVFSLDSTRRPQAHFSEPLSARYNRTKGRGWAGAARSEDWVYVQCAPGGERLMRQSDADTLTIPGH